MRTIEYNARRSDVPARTCGAVALAMPWRWYFGLYYFWFAYLKGGSRGY